MLIYQRVDGEILNTMNQPPLVPPVASHGHHLPASLLRSRCRCHSFPRRRLGRSSTPRHRRGRPCFQGSLCCVLCRIPPPSPFRQEVRVEHSRFASAAEPESFVTEETSGPLVGEAAQGPLGTCCWGFGGILVRFLLVALMSCDVATDSFVAFFLRRPCVASQRKRG